MSGVKRNESSAAEVEIHEILMYAKKTADISIEMTGVGPASSRHPEGKKQSGEERREHGIREGAVFSAV